MRLLRQFALVSLLVFPSVLAFVGCSDESKQTGTVVPPSEQAKQAEKNMEDFMKNQGKDAAKK